MQGLMLPKEQKGNNHSTSIQTAERYDCHGRVSELHMSVSYQSLDSSLPAGDGLHASLSGEGNPNRIHVSFVYFHV